MNIFDLPAGERLLVAYIHLMRASVYQNLALVGATGAYEEVFNDVYFSTEYVIHPKKEHQLDQCRSITEMHQILATMSDFEIKDYETEAIRGWLDPAKNEDVAEEDELPEMGQIWDPESWAKRIQAYEPRITDLVGSVRDVCP